LSKKSHNAIEVDWTSPVWAGHTVTNTLIPTGPADTFDRWWGWYVKFTSPIDGKESYTDQIGIDQRPSRKTVNDVTEPIPFVAAPASGPLPVGSESRHTKVWAVATSGDQFPKVFFVKTINGKKEKWSVPKTGLPVEVRDAIMAVPVSSETYKGRPIKSRKGTIDVTEAHLHELLRLGGIFR
jgi:hypothetical protein